MYDRFPKTGLVRLVDILGPKGPIPVSKSTWWQGVKDGRFPKPVKLGPRTTAWRAEEVRALYDCKEDGNSPHPVKNTSMSLGTVSDVLKVIEQAETERLE